MPLALKIENLSKEYRLGIISHGTLYRDLQSFWAKILNKEDPNSLLGKNSQNVKGKFLALKNINLEVNDGEVLGIIGPNGAGKSTLLKIISRVTTPTKGIIKAKGKISSLLEVGTGFHPELTGRENIYLNGAINGMGRKEVSKKLDAIVDFAGVETFLDTPVKRYSSGMHVRLGFAVAAHLEPDILIVDEVLAVGDAAFQKKAINKMEEVSQKSKRTVLFVSHNMNAVKNFCTKTILLQRGEIIKLGKTEEVINFYLNQFDHNTKGPEIRFEKNNIKDFHISKISLFDKNKQLSDLINREDSYSIAIDYSVKRLTNNLGVNFSIETLGHQNGVSSNTTVLQWSEQHHNKYKHGNEEVKKNKGSYRVFIDIPGYLLNSGKYQIRCGLSYAGNWYETHKECIIFDLYDTDSSHALKGGRSAGLLGMPLNWNETKLSD